MKRYQYIVFTLYLVFLTLAARGQDTYEFGNLSEGDIEWYKFEPAEDSYGQWACFTLTQPADVWLTLKKTDVSSSMFQMYDNEDNGIIVKDMGTSSNEMKGYANLPAGNYQVFVDFNDPEYMELGIEVKTADMELHEEDLGIFNDCFGDSYEVNMEDTYQFFHSKYYDGYACCSF